MKNTLLSISLHALAAAAAAVTITTTITTNSQPSTPVQTFNHPSDQPSNSPPPNNPPIAKESSKPLYRGFNINAWNGGKNSPPKTQDDWKSAFARIKTVPGGFNAARTYAVQETLGDGTQVIALDKIMRAADEADIDLLLGLYLGWNDGGKRFEQEFQVLRDVVGSTGLERIVGITVGNEDLYQTTTSADVLASQIRRVQEWLDEEQPDACMPVGHVDTWTNVVNASNKAVTDVSDFLVANIFPYWENAPVTSSLEYFNAALANISSFEEQEDIEIWIGETGWPVESKANFVGVPGVDNLQKYWNEIVCSQGFQERNAFFYIDCDEGDSPGWGVYGLDGAEKIDMSCDGPVS